MKKGVDYTGISVVYFCHDGEGNYLFNKRSNNCRDEHGRWDCGGGGLDYGLTVEETLRKELKEEYGVEPLEYELLGWRDVFREQDGEKTHWLALDFRVLVDRSKVINGEPHKFDELTWAPFDQHPSPMHSQYPIAREKYRDKLI